MNKVMILLIFINYTLVSKEIGEKSCTNCMAILSDTKPMKNKSKIIIEECRAELDIIDSLTWIEVVAEDMDIYQLAEYYYGDRDKYIDIYLANREVIEENLEVVDGMFLKIPIVELFKEQPMFLNRD